LGNRVLARLARPDFALLKPHLEAIDLPLLTVIETAGERIDAVYFIDQGFASVVADGPGKRDLEVGIIGREGMTGLTILLGQERAQHTSYIQVAGHSRRIGTTKLRHAINQSVGLHQSLLLCVQGFLNQTTETALANGRSKTEERLARWLLMAHDRIDGNELPLTHRLLAIMLGVQRPAVTVAVQVLERAGLIRAGRRAITMLDRKRLIKFAKGAYVAPEDPLSHLS
jgi:CRP-like cAMP-binding protein